MTGARFMILAAAIAFLAAYAPIVIRAFLPRLPIVVKG
jgi:hypothetical protein